MRYITVFLVLLIGLGGCLQQRSAPVDQRGSRFYGKDANYDFSGNELPRYSNSNPAPMTENQDDKYVNDTQQTYGVSAAVEPIDASDLAPIEATPLSPITVPIAATTAVPNVQQSASRMIVDTQLTAQQEADKAAAALQAADKAVAQQNLTAEASTLTATPPPIMTPAITLPPAVSAWEKEKAIVMAEASNSASRELSAIKATVTPATAAIKPAFLWPLKGEVIKSFGAESEGINIAGRSGEPIRASADGVVVHVGEKLTGYGKMIIVQHTSGYVTTYAHLSDAVVAMDDNVIAGQLIGFVGKTGNVTSPQLQFTIREGTKAINPTALLK